MLTPDVYPTVVMDDRSYWYQLRCSRSDAAQPNVVEVVMRFWVTDEVSRSTRNSANRDMHYMESKAGFSRPSSVATHSVRRGETALILKDFPVV